MKHPLLTRRVDRDDPANKLIPIAMRRCERLVRACMWCDGNRIESLMVSCYLQGVYDVTTAVADVPVEPVSQTPEWKGGL